ncbi:TRAP transporter large permease [Alkalihalobacillus oceani]|uniref:TRAP transporter large permease n=1 Tax=Halalkalibacter oceani TaxID=1653776 RepID=UPI00203F7A3A|nr:TRAP transporter large permease [Halalkalibacter oceani]MCM3759167.1 TRAP transporter large permease [Halalkalibacter oceani]
MTLKLFLLLGVLFIVGVPIAISLGLSSIFLLQLEGKGIGVVAQKVFEGLDKFSLMAVPFFILAGALMQKGGIARRLLALANVLVGWFRGGLGAASVLTTMFFSTMSGSSSATTAAIGSVMIPSMEKKGYPRNFATALTAASGELGVIIPPSISMIVYGLVANVSIGGLFLAGIIPGILIGLSLMITVSIVAKIKGFDEVTKIDKGSWFKELWRAFKDAFWALLMPIIILGGIYFGLFTPTEAAVVAVVYGFIVGFFIYREIKLKDIADIFGKAAITTGIILLLVGFASIFGYILTINQVPHMVAESIAQISDSPVVFLLLVNILLFITGMFMETLASIIILGPILAPIAIQFGVDPIHFGIIMVVNLAIGMVTPPVGVNLFVACQIARLRIDQLFRPLAIFLAVLITNVLLITYLPILTLWLPNL